MPKSPSVDPLFPGEKLHALLSSWWDSKKNSPLAAPKNTELDGTVFDLQPEMSSQQAVVVLVNCTTLLGYRPSKKVIKKGGYASREEFLKSMIDRLQTEWNTKHPPTNPTYKLKEPYTHAAI
jgi:hypothetical protein